MVLRVAAGKLATAGCALLLLGAVASAQTDSPPSKAAPQKSESAAPHKTKAKSRKTRRSARRTRGQQKIDPKRTLEIQEALIREHYLEGKPSGVWNDATQRAMQRYQADNNWQSKTTPDARALIKLGLGPDHDHLLNPESAMTTQPQGTHDASVSSQPSKADPGKQQP